MIKDKDQEKNLFLTLGNEQNYSRTQKKLGKVFSNATKINSELAGGREKDGEDGTVNGAKTGNWA